MAPHVIGNERTRGNAPQAAILLGEDRPGATLAGAAYNADHVPQAIIRAGAAVIIPNNPSWPKKHPLDQDLCKECRQIECRFSKPRHFRCAATRGGKTARNSLAAAAIVAAILWLK